MPTPVPRTATGHNVHEAAGVARLLERLAPSLKRDVFQLEQLTGGLCLSRSSEGRPCLVVLLDDRPRSGRVEYRGILLQVHHEASIELAGQRSEQAIGVVECREARHDHNFCVFVADACSLVLKGGASISTSRQLVDHIVRWADVFASPGGLSHAEVVGLWGELEVLAQMPSVDRALEAWHGPEAGIFDFGANRICLEVKTTTGPRREHEFLLEQLLPPSPDASLYIASVQVLRDPASGRTLDEQVEAVRRKLSSGLLLDRKLARLKYVLGADSERYSLQNLDFFVADTVARPQEVDRTRLRSVRFISDLTGLQPLRGATVRRMRTSLTAS